MFTEESAHRAHHRRLLTALCVFLLPLVLALAVDHARAQRRDGSPGQVVPWSSFLANANPYGFDSPLPIRLGEVPTQIRIPDAGIDARIENGEIVDGVMQDPSASDLVAWYRASGRIGGGDNAVMAGHLDFWDVGPAVFFNLPSLQPGALIEIEAESGATYRYVVDWVKAYTVEDLTTEALQEIVGKSDSEQLTLITCGGTFDNDRGVYLERIVVRARPAT